MQNWYRLFKQVEITMNLLQPSILNPIMLAYAQLNGEFDFNCTPMDPPVTRTLVNDKPHNRGTWDPHGHNSWYVRSVVIHYFCLTSYIPKMSKERVSDTTDFPRKH